MKFQTQFNAFVEAISLGDTQLERIGSAVTSLSDYLSGYYGINKSDIFLQGSCANGTAVKPAPSLQDGEYDVDLVILSATPKDSASDALDDLESALLKNGIYKDKVVTNDRKETCVRLEYVDDDAGGFHVDLVPARHDQNVDYLQIPRRSDGWFLSNPIGYTKWCRDNGDGFLRTIKMLKRWRDENQHVKKGIKSVTLQVITAQDYDDASTDAERLASALGRISDLVSKNEYSPPSLPNPSVPEEDLADRWDHADYIDFRKCVIDAAETANLALMENDEAKSAELWINLLGEDFPHTTKSLFPISSVLPMGDISHQKTMNWPFRPAEYSVDISATKRLYRNKTHYQNGYKTIKVLIARQIYNSGDPIESHWPLFFQASTRYPAPYEIFWQVVNTGSDAMQAQSNGENGLRGGFYPCNGKNEVNTREEATRYQGTHTVEAFVISNGVCVARSGKFIVGIRK